MHRPPLSYGVRGNKGDRLLFPVAIAGGCVIDPCHAKNPARAAGWICYHVINRGNGRATIFHKPQDYFGLRLFQTFQTPALSSIEGFNRFAPFITGSVRSSRFNRSTATLCSKRLTPDDG